MQTTAISIPWAGSRTHVRLLYGVWSKLYDWTVSWDPAYGGNARRMVEATVREGDRVLDVGVGTGLLAEYASPVAREYVGIDYSGSMLAKAADKAASRHWENVSLRWADARRLPFDRGTFDVVLSSFVLPHFARDERGEVLGEMARVARPEGRLGLFLAQGEVAPLFPTRTELEDDLGAAGFVDARIQDLDDVYRIVTAATSAAE